MDLIVKGGDAVFTVTEIIVERIAQGKHVLNIVRENHAVQAVSEIIAHRIAQVYFLQLYSKMATFFLYISCILNLFRHRMWK